MEAIKLKAKEKALINKFVAELQANADSQRSAGVAIMETLKRVSDAFPDYKATTIADLLEKHGLEYSAVTIGIYIGTIRTAKDKGVDITGMTNTEAREAINGGKASANGAKMTKAKALSKIKALAKKAMKDYGASLSEICEALGIELEASEEAEEAED